MPTTTDGKRFYATNARIFYQIAKESIERMRKEDAAHKRHREDGQPGYVITLDPQRKGFKASFVAIVFAGIFIEAILHQIIASKLGIQAAKSTDKLIYEDKLKRLGCDDSEIAELCKRYRDSRREIVHEKAYLGDDSSRIAQEEAENAFDLVEKIVDYFGLRKNWNLEGWG